MLSDKKPSFTILNKNGFSEIFRSKTFSSSRAEKARGCFGSNKVRKTANMFRSRNLDMSFATRTFKAEEQ